MEASLHSQKLGTHVSRYLHARHIRLSVLRALSGVSVCGRTQKARAPVCTTRAATTTSQQRPCQALRQPLKPAPAKSPPRYYCCPTDRPNDPTRAAKTTRPPPQHTQTAMHGLQDSGTAMHRTKRPPPAHRGVPGQQGPSTPQHTRRLWFAWLLPCPADVAAATPAAAAPTITTQLVWCRGESASRRHCHCHC